MGGVKVVGINGEIAAGQGVRLAKSSLAGRDRGEGKSDIAGSPTKLAVAVIDRWCRLWPERIIAVFLLPEAVGNDHDKL